MEHNKHSICDKLELQLHEQYAINNNANVSSFIAMISALIVAFAGYGYVLYQYLMGESSRCCCQIANANMMLLVASFAVLVVIFILYMVAIEIGAGQRSNQFVIHNIRKRAYGYNKEELKKIYPEGYTPEGKNYLDFIQGIYNTLSWIFLGVYVAIAILSFWIIKQNCCCLCGSAIVWLYMISFRCSKFEKYKKLDLDNNIHWIQRVIFPIIIIGLSIWGITICTECKCLFATIAAAAFLSIINVCSNSK